MTKGMTKREKMLVLLLLAIVVLVGWYKLIFEPVTNKIDEFNNLQATEESEIQTNLPKVQAKKEMEEELEALRKDGSAKRIPMYDNSKPLLAALNSCMVPADNYSITFGAADTDDYIVIHTINVDFSASNYATARALIDGISEDTFPNQISDVGVSMGSNEDSTTTVSLVVTFFEVAG